MARNRPGHQRSKHPKRIRLTERDRRICETIHAFDGMMSLKQIDRLFFSGRGGTWARERLRDLYDNGYLDMPDAGHIHKVPVGETVYWLDLEGAKIVAGLQGVTLKDLGWRNIGRWSLIAHDLAVNDFRIAVMEACELSDELTLFQWVPESEFVLDQDTVEYETRSGATAKKQIRPDAFFTIRRPHPRQPSKKEEFAFLLEQDMGTEDYPRFARDKVMPGIAYLHSHIYQERFGVNYGAFLVVTTSELRMANMKAQTERAGGEDMFYFTTFSEISAETVLTQPIWKAAGSTDPISLIPDD
jgi:hypothetical protein